MCSAPNCSGSRVSPAHGAMWQGPRAQAPVACPVVPTWHVAIAAALGGRADGGFGDTVWPCCRVGPNPPFKRTPAGGPAPRGRRRRRRLTSFVRRQKARPRVSEQLTSAERSATRSSSAGARWWLTIGVAISAGILCNLPTWLYDVGTALTFPQRGFAGGLWRR